MKQQAAIQSRAGLGRGEASKRFDKHALLAEDSPVNREIAIAMLSALGCEVTCAADGAVALAEFRRARFDIVFMDCQMPEMDGYQASRAIREHERECGAAPTPIVALTANAMDGDREQCLAAGMSGYLAKPFTQHGIEAVLEHWFMAEAEPRSDDTAVPAAGQALDPETIDTIRKLGGERGEEFLREVLGLYLTDAPKHVGVIEVAIRDGDAEALRSAAHSLKSSSASVGAMNLSRIAKELEELGRSQRLDEAGQRVTQVRSEYDGVARALQAMQA